VPGQRTPDNRLDNSVCLITGSTSGIGRAAAIEIARLGADVILVGRSARRLADAEREVRRSSTGGSVRGFIADLASLASIRALAREVTAAVPKIHVLLNNAGVFTPKRAVTVDGLEVQFAVNHLAPFLLTNLLIERLAAAEGARIVTVASQVERSGSIDFDDLQGVRDYDPIRAYRQSKLANVLFSRELARRTANRGMTALSLHPGVYTTRLLDAYNGWSSLVTRFRDRGLARPDDGGRVLAHAAAAPELSECSGAHLHEYELRAPSAQAQDDSVAARLWEASASLVSLHEFGTWPAR
jgi:NAD(P)-dependent dehydrogenase (short-subunit alcohol dehydrogenase family)